MASKDSYYTHLVNSVRWRRLRNWWIANHPTCDRCEKEFGIFTPATCVHHIEPVEEAPSRAEQAERCYSVSNLQALCQRCHHDIHTADGYHSSHGVKERKELRAEEAYQEFFGTWADL